MKSNISVFNAIMRITCGLTVVAWATSRMVKRPERLGFLFAAMMGAMKVGEGIFRYCPTTDFLKNGGISIKEPTNSDKQKEKDHDE